MADHNIPAAPDGTAAVPVGGIPPAPDGTQAVAVSQPSQSDTPQSQGFLDKMSNQPLTSHTAATEAGLANIAQGVGQGAEGLYNTLRHPIDTAKGLAAVPGKVASGASDVAKNTVEGYKNLANSPDPVGTSLSLLAKPVGNAAGQAAFAAGTAAAGAGVSNAVKTVKVLRDIPAALSSDTVGTLNSVAQKEGLPALTASKARDAAGELSQNFIKRAKSNYGVVDDAVGGDLKPVQEKIQDLKTSIRTNRVLNPELADKLSGQLADQQQRLTDLIGEAKQNGVANADDLMKAADKDYSKGMAMKKVTDGIKTASGQSKMNGHPSPGGFASQIDRLERTGTLQRAVGPEATDALVQNAKDGLSHMRTVANVTKVAKAGVNALPYAAAGYGGIKAISALSGK